MPMVKNRKQEDWIKIFSERGAYWRHDGNPKRPHALLTSGLHSDGFFNWSVIAQDPQLAQEAATDLSCLVYQECSPQEWYKINRVVGPGNGAITLADRMAGFMSSVSQQVLGGFTEKNPDGTMSIARFPVYGEYILACEDTMTTSKSFRAMVETIYKAGGVIAPYVAVICNRSGLINANTSEIIALITTPMAMWEADECPLCKQGSEAIRPKRDDNWVRLNAEY